MRSTASRARLLVLPLVALIAGCDAITGSKDKSFTMTIEDATVSLAQGSRDSILVTVTRSNFNDPITMSVVGSLPTGVSASFLPNPLQGAQTQTYLRFTATSSATPGSVTVTVRATGEGLPDKGLPVDVSVTVNGTYTLSLLDPSVTVAQGGAGDATVLLTRSGGNASSVSLEVTGAPAGMTATAVTPSSDRGVSLVVAAGPTVPPGTYPLNIKASAAGISPDQNAQLSVVVIAPPATATVSVPFCAGGVPVWFAHKNEGFGWQRVTSATNAFSFPATSKVAIAYVLQNGSEFQTNMFFASRAEIASLNDRDCDGTKTLTGTASGLTAGQTAVLVMGANSATTTSGNYTLQGVAARPLDLVATRGTLSGDGFLTPDKMVVRRGLDLTGTIPALDFNSTEAFAPVISNLTVTGFTTGFNLEFQNNLWTATSTYGSVQSGAVPGGATTFAAVPAGQLASGDLHELFIDAYQSNGQVGHAVVSYFAAPGNRTETIAPLLSQPAVTTLTVAPYARLRAQLPSQSEYGSVARFVFLQGTPGNRKFILIAVSSAYLGGTPTTWDLVIPDFSAIAGFTNTWMLTGGQATPFSAEAFSGRGDLLFGALPAAGDQIRLAYRVAQATVGLRQAGPAELRARRVPRLGQYFWR